MSGPERLSGEDLTSFLGSLRAGARGGPSPARPAAAAPPSPDATRFDTLPFHAQIEATRAFGQAFSIDSPFYRLHERGEGVRDRVDGRDVVSFGTYDYVGAAHHPDVIEAAVSATRLHGPTVSASRITAGDHSLHRALERELADTYASDDAVAFVSGHATALSVIPTLVGSNDLVIHDALMHNCCALGAQYSGATRRIFPHNDLSALAEILQAERPRFKRCLIMTEGLFSMDGDGPDLARLVELKTAHGAWLMMDEAHSLGVMGRTGRGSFEAHGVDPRAVDIWFGTLSKALASCGGYVAGNQALIDILRFNAPGLVFSVGLPPPGAASALAALRLLKREPARVDRLRANGALFLRAAQAAGLDTGASRGEAVVPVIVGDSVRAILLSNRLLERGFYAFPTIPPGVPERSARLRFFVTASHEEQQIRDAVAATREELDRLVEGGFGVLSPQGTPG